MASNNPDNSYNKGNCASIHAALFPDEDKTNTFSIIIKIMWLIPTMVHPFIHTEDTGEDVPANIKSRGGDNMLRIPLKHVATSRYGKDLNEEQIKILDMVVKLLNNEHVLGYWFHDGLHDSACKTRINHLHVIMDKRPKTVSRYNTLLLKFSALRTRQKTEMDEDIVSWLTGEVHAVNYEQLHTLYGYLGYLQLWKCVFMGSTSEPFRAAVEEYHDMRAWSKDNGIGFSSKGQTAIINSNKRRMEEDDNLFDMIPSHVHKKKPKVRYNCYVRYERAYYSSGDEDDTSRFLETKSRIYENDEDRELILSKIYVTKKKSTVTLGSVKYKKQKAEFSEDTVQELMADEDNYIPAVSANESP
jgi:hypothetical protein